MYERKVASGRNHSTPFYGEYTRFVSRRMRSVCALVNLRFLDRMLVSYDVSYELRKHEKNDTCL